MKASNDNGGGYPATLMRTWLEGAAGDGSGTFATKLKTALGGAVNYLYTLRLAHSVKGNYAWNNFTVFLPTEIEIFGYQTWGDEVNSYNTNVLYPIYMKSGAYRIKRYNAKLEKQKKIDAYKAELAAIDQEAGAGRAVRGLALGAAEKAGIEGEDMDRLTEMENRARELRAEIAELMEA